MKNVNIYGFRPNRALDILLYEIKNRNHLENNIIMLVPEHYTLQAEKDIIYKLNLPGLFNIEVLSPTRLAYRILEKSQSIKSELLSETGESIAISMVLNKIKNKLKYYKSDINLFGFNADIYTIISDLIQSNIDIDSIKAYLSIIEEPILKIKWADILLIYSSYLDFISNKFISSHSKMDYVANRVEESGYIKGKYVFVYGFDLISHSLLNLLLGIAKDCYELNLYLTLCSKKADDYNIYKPMEVSVLKFISKLQNEGINYTFEYIENIPLKSSLAIQHIDRVLFASAKPNTNYLFDKDNQSIHILPVNSPYEESMFIANSIAEHNLAGTAYDKIAILIPTLGDYSFVIETALNSLNIPFFNNEQLVAVQHPVIRYLIDVCQAIANDFKDEYIMALLFNSASPLSIEDRTFLKKYAKKYGIHRKKWLNEFIRGNQKEIELAETCRIAFIEPLYELKIDLLNSKNADDTINSLFEFLKKLNAFNELEATESTLINFGMYNRADQNQQVFAYILEVFDQLYMLLEGKNVNITHLPEYLKNAFASISILALPPVEGMVIIGNLDHMLISDIDVLYIVGLNENILSKNDDSIISNDERIDFEQHLGTQLGVNNDFKTLISKLNLKKAMTLAKNHLYLSYSKTDMSSKPLWPSSVINDLENRYFNNLVVENYIEKQYGIELNDLLVDFFALSQKLFSTQNKLEETKIQNKLFSYFSALNNEQIAILDSFLSLNANKDGASFIEPDTAQKLFRNKEISISRLEEFARCPFRHFMKYGIKPQINKIWEIDPLLSGTLYHSVLETFANLYKDSKLYPNENEIEQIIENIINQDEALKTDNPFNDSARSLNVFSKMKKSITNAAKTLIFQLNQGDYTIYDTELSFGINKALPPIIFKLNDGRIIYIHGNIDRLDSFSKDNKTYVRIIDYKSSSKKLNASELWYGSQLQLLIYLAAASRANSNNIAAGAFYFQISEPWLDIIDDNEEDIKSAKLKELRLSGIVLKDFESIIAMDNDYLNPKAISKLINKDSSFTKRSDLFTEEELSLLIEHCITKSLEFTELIYSGEIQVKPIATENSSACDYCDYTDICFKTFNKLNKIEKLDFDELKARIK